MVLVNEAQGYLTCLECHDVFTGDDETAWLDIHVGTPPRCGGPAHRWSRGFERASIAWAARRRQDH